MNVILSLFHDMPAPCSCSGWVLIVHGQFGIIWPCLFISCILTHLHSHYALNWPENWEQFLEIAQGFSYLPFRYMTSSFRIPQRAIFIPNNYIPNTLYTQVEGKERNRLCWKRILSTTETEQRFVYDKKKFLQ